MALTELQLPNKIEFYGVMQKAATDMDTLIHDWENIAEFLAKMTVADLDAMGVSDTDNVRQDLINFRTVLNEMVDYFNGDSTAQTQIPADVIDEIRKIRR